MIRPEIVQVPAMRVVGISIRTSNQAGAEAASGQGPITRLWQTVKERNLAETVPNLHVSGEIVAVYHDYADGAHGDYTLTLGPRVTSLHQVPDDLTGVEVPFQTYARFPVAGNPAADIPATWQTILHDTSLPRTFNCDLEVYRPGDTPDDTRVEIFIAIADTAGG